VAITQKEKKDGLRIVKKNPGNAQGRIVNSGIASRNTGIIGENIVIMGFGRGRVEDFRN
jgi:hypothetical protein